MLSDTLQEELQRYGIGPRIRALRLKKKLGLVELGAHTGLSTATLSKLERGQLFPTLPTLLRIAMVFGVGLEHFFSPETDRPLLEVVRSAQRLRLPWPPGDGPTAYLFESLDYPVPDRKMEAFRAIFPLNSAPSAPHSHGSAELIYVLEGSLELRVGDERVGLETGDSAYFDSAFPHGYARAGSGECVAIVVTVA